MKRRWIFSLLTASLVAGMVGTSYAEVKVSGGELRVRGVMVDNKDAGLSAAQKAAGMKSDGGFFEQRTRLNVDASTDNAKIFIQVQDSRKWGEKAGTGDNTVATGQDVETLDLAQGYVEIGNLFNAPLSVKIGRQAMAYGEHRLIGSLEWSNNARRFDAIKGTIKLGDVADIDFWTAKVSDANHDWGNDTNFNGVYTSFKKVRNHEIDVYLLQKIVGSADVLPAVTGTQTNSNFYTLGGRIKGDLKNINLDYAVELASQFGDFTDTIDKSAAAFAARIGYTIPNALGLRLGAELDGASGDDSTTSEDEAFDNLYPTNHYLYGYTDDVNWSNMAAFNLNASIKPIDKLKLSAEYWTYSLYEEDSSGNDDNGSEINGKANYELSKNINLEAAYVIRDAGDVTAKAYSDTVYGTIPADKSATFGYFQINVKFM